MGGTVTILFSVNTITSVLLLAGVASAPTPAGFVPEVKSRLKIIFRSKTVDAPGASLAKAGMLRNQTQTQIQW
jgi:hypothetical protein